MRPRPAVALLGATLGLAAAVTAPTASGAPVAPGAWELLEPASPGSPGKTADPAVFRGPDGLLRVAWVHTNGPLDETLASGTFGADGSRPAVVTPVVSHWTDISDGAFAQEPGGLQLYFGGQQTTTTGAPLGLMSAAPAGAAAWTPPTQLTSTYGTVSAAAPSTPGPGAPASAQAYESQSHPVLRFTGAPGTTIVPTSGIPGTTESSPSVVVDASGTYTVAWCVFGDGIGGIYTQTFSPALGASTPATPVPGSTTGYAGKQYATCVLQSEASRRTPMAARAGGGVYVAGTKGYPQLNSVVVWKVGGGTLTAVSRPGVGNSEPQVVADPAGRLWVGWLQSRVGGTTLIVRRSNRTATVLGAAVKVPSPAGWTVGSFEGNATAAHLDLIGQFTKATTNSIRHTIALPGLTLKITKVVRLARGRRAVTYGVSDAGDPVPGATVTVRALSRRTGATGTVTLTFRGATHATAKKAGYTKATV